MDMRAVRATGTLTVGGVVRVFASRGGRIVKLIEQHNLVTDVGRVLTAELLRNAGYDTGLSYCSFGSVSGTPVVGGTTMSGEAVRRAITGTSRVGAVVTFETFFPAADCAFHIYEVGHWGHSTAGTTLNTGMLFEHSSVDLDNSGTVYDLTVSYELEVE